MIKSNEMGRTWAEIQAGLMSNSQSQLPVLGCAFRRYELAVIPVERLKPGMAELVCNDGGVLRESHQITGEGMPEGVAGIGLNPGQFR